MIPSFITGANARITVAGKVIAYAQDVSYNVTVQTIPIEAMGRYEVVSNEPVAYFVDGTLSIIRYTTVAKTNAMPNVAATGNSLNKVETDDANKKAVSHVSPYKLLASSTFTLLISQMTANAGTADENGNIGQSVIQITDCRFTRKGGGINKRGVLVEQMAFNAILQRDDDDTGGLVARTAVSEDLS